MPDRVFFSLVTTCKGRLGYLRESLPTWLGLSFEGYEVVVVDYDCPDGTRQYLQAHRGELLEGRTGVDLRVVRVDDRPRFNLNDARNRGIEAARGAWVFLLDADVSVTDPLLLSEAQRWLEEEGALFLSNLVVLSTDYAEGLDFYRAKYGLERIDRHSLLPTQGRLLDLSGTACFSRRIWEEVGGFRAEISAYGWGSDDIEFYIRYLNRAVARRLGGARLSREEIELAQREVLACCRTFPPRSLAVRANRPEEKDAFYPRPKRESLGHNKRFVVRLLNGAGTEEEPHQSAAVSNLGVRSLFSEAEARRWPFPSWFPSWYYRRTGSFFWRANDLPRSMGAFRALWELSPEASFARILAATYLAAALHRLKDPGFPVWLHRVRNLLSASWEGEEDLTPVEVYRVASLLEGLGSHQEAQTVFRWLLEQGPGGEMVAGILYHLGLMHLEAGDAAGALGLFLRALQENPRHALAAERVQALQTHGAPSV